MTNTCPTIGTLGLHRTASPHTLVAMVDLYAALDNFAEPAKVRGMAQDHEFIGRDDDELLVGGATFAVAFCEPRAARDLGAENIPDFEQHFNDEIYFSERVPQIFEGLGRYLARLDAPLAEETVNGLAILDDLYASPGFPVSDIFDASLLMLSTLMMPSAHGMLFLHTEQDQHDSLHDLWSGMARQNEFRRRHPDWKINTFRNVGPASGTMAGLLPAGGSQRLDGEWIHVGCEHASRTDDTTPKDLVIAGI